VDAPSALAIGWPAEPKIGSAQPSRTDTGLLCGAAVVGVGFALPPGAAEAMATDASLANTPEGLIEDVRWDRPLDIGMATIGVAIGAADGSAGGIAAVASVTRVDRKGG
jgi:hypothetical protein